MHSYNAEHLPFLLTCRHMNIFFVFTQQFSLGLLCPILHSVAGPKELMKNLIVHVKTQTSLLSGVVGFVPNISACLL